MRCGTLQLHTSIRACQHGMARSLEMTFEIDLASHQDPTPKWPSRTPAWSRHIRHSYWLPTGRQLKMEWLMAVHILPGCSELYKYMQNEAPHPHCQAAHHTTVCLYRRSNIFKTDERQVDRKQVLHSTISCLSKCAVHSCSIKTGGRRLTKALSRTVACKAGICGLKARAARMQEGVMAERSSPAALHKGRCGRVPRAKQQMGACSRSTQYL